LIAQTPTIQAVLAGSEMGDLHEPASYHDVLQKVDHLILVAEVMVEQDGGHKSERREA
jgi:hypothetical protein